MGPAVAVGGKVSTLIDAKFTTLRNLGHTGSVSDMIFQFWGAEGGTGNTSIERFRSAMNAAGVAYASTEDMWNTFLGNLTLTGALVDREYRFWSGLVANYFDVLSIWNDGAIWID
jgi:hypothetical protein